VPYDVFTGSDGRSFVLGVGTDALWIRLIALFGDESGLANEATFATNAGRIEHRHELLPRLRQSFAQRPASFWLEKLTEARIPAAAIQSVPEALSGPHVQERALIVEIDHPLLGIARSIANPVRMSETPPAYRLPPPLLGQHSSDILKELGFDSAQIAQLRQDLAI
jgi:crotonobetainyl-CoA:carnitine CoA-transferase CaiB-like acyl-CoA transferase